MAVDATKVVATRDIKVYTVPFSSTNAIPADTILWGTAWGTPAGQSAPYVEVGYTDGGLNFSIEVTRGEIRVDQEVDPILRPVTGRNMRLSTSLAEFTAANLQSAAGQGTATTLAAASGVRGHDDLAISSTVADNFRTVGYDVKNQGDSEAIRIIGWKGLPSGAVAGTINPTDKATIALDMTLHPDTSVTPARILLFRDIIPALP
jgi:hypothetical protein